MISFQFLEVVCLGHIWQPRLNQLKMFGAVKHLYTVYIYIHVSWCKMFQIPHRDMSTSKCQCYGEAMVNSPYWIVGFKTTKKVVSSSWCWTFLSKNRCLKQQKTMEVALQCPWQLKLPKGWVRGVVLRSTVHRNIIPLKKKQWYPGSKDGKGMLVYCHYIQIKKTCPKNQEGTCRNL